MKSKSKIRPIKGKKKDIKVAVPKSNMFIMSFEIAKNKDGKHERSALKVSFDGAQYPALMAEEDQQQISVFGVEVLLSSLAETISMLADTHEKATKVPASQTKEKVISLLEGGKRIKLIGV